MSSNSKEGRGKLKCCCETCHVREGAILLGCVDVVVGISAILRLTGFKFSTEPSDSRKILPILVDVLFMPYFPIGVLFVLGVVRQNTRMLRAARCAAMVLFVCMCLFTIVVSVWLALDSRAALDAMLDASNQPSYKVLLDTAVWMIAVLWFTWLPLQVWQWLITRDCIAWMMHYASALDLSLDTLPNQGTPKGTAEARQELVYHYSSGPGTAGTFTV